MQSILRWLPLLAAAAILPDPSQGQDIITLDALVQQTLQSNQRLASLRLAVTGAELGAQATGLLPEPMLSAMVLPMPIYTARGAQRSIWRAEQRIPWPGTRADQRTAADFEVRASEAGVEALRADLVWRISDLYWSWTALDEERDAIQQYVQIVQGMEDAAAVQYEVGGGQQQSILKAQIEKNRLHRRLAMLDVRLAATWSDITALSGVQVSHRVPARVAPGVVPPPDSAALGRDPELARLRAQVDAGRARLRIAQRSGKPDVTLSVQYVDIADTAFPMTSTGADAVMLGVGLALPTQRRAYRARQAQRTTDIEMLEATMRDRWQSLLAEARGAQAEIEANRRALVLLTGTLIPQAESALEATAVAYSNGRTGFIDLLDAERTLFDLDVDRIATVGQIHRLQAYLDRLALRAPGTND